MAVVPRQNAPSKNGSGSTGLTMKFKEAINLYVFVATVSDCASSKVRLNLAVD